MIFYLTKRLFGATFTLFILMSVTFFMMKVVPGGPFDTEKAMPEEVRQNIERIYHLDQPLLKQYYLYLSNLCHGELGPSYRFLGSRSVNEIIQETLPVSIELGVYAIVFAILVGVPLGVLSAFKQNSIFDFSAMFIAIAGVSLPNFLTASILILIFSVQLNWLPPALWEGWESRILPAITLGIRPLALIARMTRASVLESLDQDYIRTAMAKGLGQSKILFKHALKNALIPVITILGPLVAAVITGSFVVEVIFAIPGMGQHFVGAVMDRDYTLIMGVTLVYGVVLIFANLIVDMTYTLIDPRIRLR